MPKLEKQKPKHHDKPTPPINQPNQFQPPVVQQQIPPYKPKFAIPEINEDGTTYGEFDTERKYPFPIGWMNSVVVTQYNVFTAPSGQQMIDEGSRRVMPYNTGVFTKLVKDKGFENTQYFILHNPRI